MADRFNISKINRNIIDKLDESKYIGKIGPSDVTNKDIYMYAMALGNSCPTEFQSKDGFFHIKDLLIEDKAIIYSLLYNEIGGVENLINMDTIVNVADKMANTGFQIIAEKLNSISLDNIEKKMILELDNKFEKLTFNF